MRASSLADATPASAPLLTLMYHSVIKEPLPVYDWCFVEAARFREQMEYVREHFDIIPLNEAMGSLWRGLERPTVAITFDDGFQNKWFCRLNRALSQTSCGAAEWDGAELSLETPGDKASASARLQAELKRRHPSLLEGDLLLLMAELGVDPDEPLEADSPFRVLTHDP